MEHNSNLLCEPWSFSRRHIGVHLRGCSFKLPKTTLDKGFSTGSRGQVPGTLPGLLNRWWILIRSLLDGREILQWSTYGREDCSMEKVENPHFTLVLSKFQQWGREGGKYTMLASHGQASFFIDTIPLKLVTCARNAHCAACPVL